MISLPSSKASFTPLELGYKNKVEMARAFTLVWSGQGIPYFYRRPAVASVQEHEPTLFEIWVCVDVILD